MADGSEPALPDGRGPRVAGRYGEADHDSVYEHRMQRQAAKGVHHLIVHWQTGHR